MSTPFKMKGSPMKRNFGIGNSPLKDEKKKVTTKKTSKEKYGSDEELIVKGFTKDDLGRWRNKEGLTPGDVSRKAQAKSVGGTYGTQRKMIVPVSGD
jgi:hypothetical protein